MKSDAFTSSREDAAVAFCYRCGAPCEDIIPTPGAKWRCRECRRSCAVPKTGAAGRVEKVRGLLTSRNGRVVEMAQAALITYGEQSVEPLLRMLTEHPGTAKQIAPVLGEIGSERAVDLLAREMRARERQIAWRKWFWRWVVLGGTIWLIAVKGWWWVLFFTLGYMGVETFLPYRRAAIQALREIGNPRAVGPVALAHRQRELRRETGPTLHALLPRVADKHAGTLKAAELRALEALLWDRDRELAWKALRALVHVGTERTLQLFRRGAPILPKWDLAGRELESAARELEQHIRWRRESPTLLRAADAGAEPDSEILLRPAGPGEVERQQLLRSSDGQE